MKKLTDKQLTRIRAYVENYDATAPEPGFITAEHVAKWLDIKLHIVEQAFHKLNLEGLLSTPSNSANRHYRDAYPAATLYYITTKDGA